MKSRRGNDIEAGFGVWVRGLLGLEGLVHGKAL